MSRRNRPRTPESLPTEQEFEDLNEVLSSPVPEVIVTTTTELVMSEPEVKLNLDLGIFTNNLSIAPNLIVGILGATQSPELSTLKAYLARFKIASKQFTDTFADPALAHLLKNYCIVVVVSEDSVLERKVLASGRFILRLSNKPSECPYVKNVDYKNLTHVIIDSREQLNRRGTPQAIARYAITGQPI